MKISQYSVHLASVLPAVEGGHWLPAAMQRPYVWQKEDVLALFDSLLCRYPVGGILCWDPGSKADLSVLAKGRLGPVLISSEGDAWNPDRLILDGQNRLASIAWAMLNDEAPAGISYSDAELSTWLAGEVLVLDGETQSIMFVPRAEADKGLRLPAWAINTSTMGISKKINRLIRSRYDKEWAQFPEAARDRFLDFWDAAQQAFNDAKITLTVIEDATPEEAKKAFMRICRVGVVMSEDDFNAAVQWSPAQHKEAN